ncbi:hypothetical protein [Bifidobacterium sp. ESL0825]|uniref:hypothetical protein n=1 Tax=Bifidobacterium sp. ESL0825 TaxID=3448587 RepID=UPI0040421BD7
MKGIALPRCLTHRVLPCLIVALACLGLTAFDMTPTAEAETVNPTLTVQLKKGHSGQGDQKDILPSAPISAGAGYVFRALRLDVGTMKSRVEALDHNASADKAQEAISKEVAANPDAFKDKTKPAEYYGVSDQEGTITNASEAKSQGVWLTGANLDLDAPSLSGGSPAVFDGDYFHASYWLVTLVATPKNAKVKADPVVVQLPLYREQGEVHPLYDVTISPKLVDVPQIVPIVRSGPGKLAATGVSMVAPGILLMILALMGLYLAVVARSWNSDEH